ncbi:MAG TPA: hypothetical protein VFH47_08030, partial [Candidatus Thermoplasmatota archaeon]|nr:hypothetical protein [Candidatus Thermoplasmatota archaeon]
MVAAVFTYHTGGAWLLVVITFHHMMRWLDGQSSSVAFVEIGAAAILFFGFTDNAYTGVPQLLANASFQEGFAKVFVPLAPFLHQKLAANPYAYYRPLLNPLGILKISFLVLFGSAILWHVLAAARRRSMSHLPPAMLAILALAAADMIAYLALGQFNLRVLMFFGPVVAACLLFNQARRLTAPRIGATIGVILAAAIMVGSVATRDLNEVQLDDVGPAASFLHAQSDAIIVTDLRTLNKLVQSEPRLHVRDFNQGIYASLLAEGGGGDWPRPAIFAYNLRTEELPLVAGVFEWTQYRPLLRNDISSPALNAIYDDGRVVAFDHLPHRATREV